MSRGPFYSDDENRRLLMLAADMKDRNKKVTYAAIADKAIEYGISEGRNRDAVAQHISSLVDPPKEDKETEEQVDIQYAIAANERDEYKSKYENLMGIMIGQGEFWDENQATFKFDFSDVPKWLWAHEAKRIGIRMEELKVEAGR